MLTQHMQMQERQAHSIVLQAAKARLDAAIAAGYDPDAEFRSMLGRLMAEDELEDAEVDEDRGGPVAQEPSQSMTPDLDTDFMEQLSEEERQSQEDVMNPVRCHLSLLHTHNVYVEPMSCGVGTCMHAVRV